jgi:hypothetical protein
MQEFDGDLLLGGLRLKHLHGELESDQPLADSSDHLLSGRLKIDPAQESLLECGRRYRLQIEAGPAGPVEVSRIDASHNEIEFQPSPPSKPVK